MQLLLKKKKTIGINITSLIDVMFILLIFFMVTSSFVEQPGMKLELPQTKTGETARVEKMAIYIAQDGQVFLNTVPVPLDSLEAALVDAYPQAEDKTLVLKADRATEHGLVVRIMDTARSAGFKKLVIGTRVDEGV
ncbi:biopolymer transporter ExbD [candidate division KSB1 bacterium]|nr:biopolymer transporter ExbD [candidate division KSB1 bacterium]